ncbi:MAG: hypothetical protein JWO33_2967 [Caulobacteraceae bacterium]|jgi:hypothetical protein|nr:hypothetical protein [Caulobacteraceae bacterium]
MERDITAAGVIDEPLEKRIESMFRADRAWATGAVVALWITVFFVMFAIRGLMADPGIEIACWIAAALLLLFNTASIVAMIRHYGQDKAHIYGVDIRHLDAGR